MSKEVIVSTTAKARQLTQAEVDEIEHEMTLYPYKRAVGLEALKIVQKHQGWVSDGKHAGNRKVSGYSG
jgi:NADH-quinone oxidoreductase subunit E